jgi:argininosuccinate lyase
MSKLWQKENESLDADIEQFEVGDDYLLDLKLAPFDVYGSAAHATMLHKIEILTDAEFAAIKTGLKKILGQIKAKKLTLTVKDEDIHTKVENILVQEIGDAGKRLHTARSRNDQILVDTRLYAKAEILHTTRLVVAVASRLLEFAKKYEFVPMPGYTHMQIAMPSSVGMWMGAFVEALIDEFYLLDAVYCLNDMNPLGSGAGYGVSINIDRALTTVLLGFNRIQRNSIYCGNGRGKVEADILSVISSIGLHLNRLATDLLLFTTKEFDFFGISGKVTTGSSIMPQKKNLDVMELMRARCHVLLGNEAQMKGIIANLPSGYNRDYQETKRLLISSFETLQLMLKVVDITVQYLEPKPEKMRAAMIPEIYATDAAYRLVKAGTPFRDAYREIGKNLGALKDEDPVKNIKEKTHLGATGNLGLDQYNNSLKSLDSLWKEREETFFEILEKLLA